jgi:AcrR family transcriptional regulator
VPRLWTETIETHRRQVTDAVLDATGALVAEQGLTGVSMSQIALAAGIGRATLYKYFPNVEEVLTAWHRREVAGHLDQLGDLAAGIDDPGARLRAVLRKYAMSQHHGHDAAVSGMLHRGPHMSEVHNELAAFITDLIAAAAAAGAIRRDVGPPELAAFSLSALTAAGNAPSKAAVERLVEVVLDGLQTVD